MNRTITLFGYEADVPDAKEFEKFIYEDEETWRFNFGDACACLLMDAEGPEFIAIAADVAECWWWRKHEALTSELGKGSREEQGNHISKFNAAWSAARRWREIAAAARARMEGRK